MKRCAFICGRGGALDTAVLAREEQAAANFLQSCDYHSTNTKITTNITTAAAAITTTTNITIATSSSRSSNKSSSGTQTTTFNLQQRSPFIACAAHTQVGVAAAEISEKEPQFVPQTDEGWARGLAGLAGGFGIASQEAWTGTCCYTTR